jgi:hypothetical protein
MPIPLRLDFDATARRTKQARRLDPVMPQRREEGHRVPMVKGNFGRQLGPTRLSHATGPCRLPLPKRIGGSPI